MKRSINARLRALWLDVHLWIGVGLGLALVPLALSGALLVWDQPLQRMLNAERFDVADGPASLAPSAYLEAAQAAFGDRALAISLRLPQSSGDPVTVVGVMKPPPHGARAGQLTAWLDPATAKVRDVANIRASLFSTLHRLHGSLMIPQIGRKVVGWLGWAMAISSLTGLWLWFPRNGAILKALRWRRGPSLFDNLHHLIGFGSACLWRCCPSPGSVSPSPRPAAPCSELNRPSPEAVQDVAGRANQSQRPG